MYFSNIIALTAVLSATTIALPTYQQYTDSSLALALYPRGEVASASASVDGTSAKADAYSSGGSKSSVKATASAIGTNARAKAVAETTPTTSRTTKKYTTTRTSSKASTVSGMPAKPCKDGKDGKDGKTGKTAKAVAVAVAKDAKSPKDKVATTATATAYSKAAVGGTDAKASASITSGMNTNAKLSAVSLASAKVAGPNTASTNNKDKAAAVISTLNDKALDKALDNATGVYATIDSKSTKGGLKGDATVGVIEKNGKKVKIADVVL